ncbi:MAG: stage III sporulation protein AA [Oscillospiraceae bacterium]|jgi:stage III sporulation protein AA|nr:stage III sporulation protein AA [Oscillospiraceae bacterium]
MRQTAQLDRQTQSDWRATLDAYLPAPLRAMVNLMGKADAARVTEIRLRAEQPALIMAGHERVDRFDHMRSGRWIPSGEDIKQFAQTLLGHSMYARAEELRGGYVTLPGGHRAGLCGRVVLEDGKAHHIQDFSSVALRIARPVPGCADAVMPLITEDGRPLNSLIFSAPGCGKTTMLRDIARQHALSGFQVGVVDERSEIAACRQGIPQLDVGPSTDVLDACPKAEGMILMLRVFSPDILITDEIGKPMDAEAIAEASRCGAAVVVSAHAGSMEELMQRPITGALLRQRSFERYVQLGPGGQLVKAWNGAFGVLYQIPMMEPPPAPEPGPV